MSTMVRSSRWSQVVACVVLGLFVAGFFIYAIGLMTGAILGVWFALSQRPWRGFLWLTGFSVLFGLPGIWHSFAATVLAHGIGWTPNFLGGLVLSILLGVLPLTLHRLISPRLPGFVATLPFPLASVGLAALAVALHTGSASGDTPLTFFVCWLAATLVWMWNYEFRGRRIVWGGAIFAACAAAAELLVLLGGRTHTFAGLPSGWSGLAALLVLGVWAIFRAERQRPWAGRTAAIARLQSPFTQEPLHLVGEGPKEELVSNSMERFPIRDGIPTFLSDDDLTGDNGKYNHVYETIGGFYDDIQRIFCALKRFDRHAHFRSYMSQLEAKPGDCALETSVGTGLNFQYLPRGVELSGLDLSPEMLLRCRENLRRWGLDADLYLGNAESLPFADASFDVVFHVGGINFFNDRAKAIAEMIRVAKPGSLLLISDETEKHVKQVYERQPGSQWKNRKEPVKPPVDLLPPEMEDVRLEILRGGDTYALTFRKPSRVTDDRAQMTVPKPVMDGR